MGKRVRAVIEVEICESSKLKICAFVRGRSIGNVQKDCNDFFKDGPVGEKLSACIRAWGTDSGSILHHSSSWPTHLLFHGLVYSARAFCLQVRSAQVSRHVPLEAVRPCRTSWR